MGKRMTREEFLEAVFSRRYEELKGRELRTVRVTPASPSACCT